MFDASLLTFQITTDEYLQLPVFALSSLLRLTLAYLLSLGFALAYGLTAAMKHRVSHVMLPLLDVFQSVPILGFLPAVFIFIISRVPGEMGDEIAAILLIFTAMVWAMTFAVITGVNLIPNDIKEASKAYGINGLSYIKQVVLPAIYPELIWGSILAWGGAWYFIPIEEYVTVGTHQIKLQGLGYFIAKSASNNDLVASMVGLVVMVAVIISINRLIWRPLVNRSGKYKYEAIASQSKVGIHKHSRVMRVLEKYEGKVTSPIVSFLKYEKTQISSLLETMHVPSKMPISLRLLEAQFARLLILVRVIGTIGFLVIMVLSIFFLLNSPIPSTIGAGLERVGEFPGGFVALGLATLRSLSRLFSAYLIALGWTLAAGILVARSERVSRFLVPLFDVGQSIPATALFPIVILVIVNRVEGPLGLEFASLILLLTGMQWYLLFNIIGATHNVPSDLLEGASAYGIRGSRFVREILIPASFPAIVTGSIQAWGGGWNATIVSEYLSQDKQVPGLGAALVYGANTNNAPLIAAVVLIMTLTILVINRLVWHRLMKRAERYKFEY